MTGEEAVLSDAAVAALGDSVEELEDRHQLGEKLVKEEHREGAAMNPCLSNKDLDGAPKDAMVKSAP